MKIKVIPTSSWIKSNSIKRFCLNFASSADRGSSSNKTPGLFIKALAIETLCCCPPDNWLTFFVLCSSRPTSFKYFITSSFIVFSSVFFILKGKATFSKTFKWGKRAYFWNIVFTFLRFGGRSTIFSSPRYIAPLSGEINPAIILNKVVLPQPDGPIIEKNSPCSIVKLISFKIWTPSKLLLTLTIFISFFSNSFFTSNSYIIFIF